MGRRLVGSFVFCGTAIFPCEIAGRLAAEGKAGWGWFLFAGMTLAGVALNIWTGEIPTPQCTHSQKPYSASDLE